jgi:hypothetical protein
LLFQLLVKNNRVIETSLFFISASIKMRFSSIVGGVLAVLPALTAGLTISETTGQALSAFGKRSTVSDILTDIEDATTCVACNVWLN